MTTPNYVPNRKHSLSHVETDLFEMNLVCNRAVWKRIPFAKQRALLSTLGRFHDELYETIEETYQALNSELATKNEQPIITNLETLSDEQINAETSTKGNAETSTKGNAETSAETSTEVPVWSAETPTEYTSRRGRGKSIETNI